MAPGCLSVLVAQIGLLSFVSSTRLPSACIRSLELPLENSCPETRVVPAGIRAPGTPSISNRASKELTVLPSAESLPGQPIIVLSA